MSSNGRDSRRVGGGSLATIYDHKCTQCPLHKTATTVCVSARGSTKQRAMVIGEAPGANEDRRGVPFVGQAGRVLDRALREAFISEFAPDEIFITNVVKCRPPANRDPLPAEIDACFSYLNEELQAVDPIALLVLGNVAASALRLETSYLGITRTRGRWTSIEREEHEDVPVMPTFHPAFVLYQGGIGSQAWEIFSDDVTLFANLVIARYENVS